MSENIRETPLHELIQYSQDDLAILFQHMIDNPPKFQKKRWILGDRTLSVRFDSSRISREGTNQNINHDVPVTADNNHFAFFEIKDMKGKGKSASARIEASAFSAVSEFIFQVIKEKNTSPQACSESELGKHIICNFLKFIGDPRAFFSRYKLADCSQNGTLEFDMIPSNDPDEYGFIDSSGHLSLPVSIFLPKQLPQFEPGEINELRQWCYDLKPDKTDACEVPGAHTTLSYQHLLSDGSENPTPWKLKISNYTLVKGTRAFSKKNNTTLFVTFSTQIAKEIHEHIKKELERYYQYQFDLAEIYQKLLSPFSPNNT